MAKCPECGRRYFWQVIANECAATDRLLAFRAEVPETEKLESCGRCGNVQGWKVLCPVHGDPAIKEAGGVSNDL